MKLHEMLIGLVVIGLMVTALSNFIGAAVDSMDDPTSSGFDNSTLLFFNENQESIVDYEEFVNNETADADLDNRNDILGGIFSRGYQRLRSGQIMNRLDQYDRMTKEGTKGLRPILGSFADDLALAISTIIVIIIGVGLLLYFIIGKERV